MFNRKSLFILGLVAAVAAASTPSSYAVALSPFTQITHLTFSAPVALPGVTLAAGTYDFELAPAGTHRDIVRVTSRGGQLTYYMGFTREVDRPSNTSSKNLIVFGEASEDTPAPIRIWYPVNAPSGHEFVYR
jgi:hypothetical protein